MQTNAFISNSTNAKKVLLTAFSPAGEASEEWDIYRYLKRIGITDISAFYWGGNDTKKMIPPDVKAIAIKNVNDFAPEDLEGYDLIFRHATTRPGTLIASGVEISSVTKEFFKQCHAPIIGVTGTKGKGTTSTLITLILETTGTTVHLVGNIGKPLLEELPNIQQDHYVVFELSSYKLWDLRQSPHIAVVLMVEPEHLDVHFDLNDYVQAKANITRWQGEGDITIYHPTNPLTAQIGQMGLGKKIKYLTKEGAYIEDNSLIISGHKICTVAEFGLLGEHNHQNIAAAVTTAWQVTQDVKTIAKVVKEFKGLPHRLQIIAEKDGVKYVDDSFGTTPETAIAAIASFNQPLILILGGSDKGSKYEKLAKAVSQANIRKVLLIGQMADQIARSLERVNFINYEKVDGDMFTVVNRAKKLARSGDAVLLSPACASFDMFKNYIDRSEQFVAAVKKR